MFIKPENQDKAKHVIVSAILVAMFFPFFGFMVAIFLALMIGAAKEIIWDKALGLGTPDIYDFYADIGGAVSGAMLCAILNSLWPGFWPSIAAFIK